MSGQKLRKGHTWLNVVHWSVSFLRVKASMRTMPEVISAVAACRCRSVAMSLRTPSAQLLMSIWGSDEDMDGATRTGSARGVAEKWVNVLDSVISRSQLPHESQKRKGAMWMLRL